MPLKTAQGRWISDDWRYYWDGIVWARTGGEGPPDLPPPPGGSAPWPLVAIGLLIVVIAFGSAAVAMRSGSANPGFPAVP